MKIRPAPGRAARHPGTFRPLAAEGETVTPSPFWRRLLATGDVVEVDETTTEQLAHEPTEHPPQRAPVEAQTEEAAHAQ